MFKGASPLAATGPVTKMGADPVVGGAKAKSTPPEALTVFVKKGMTAEGWISLILRLNLFYAPLLFRNKGSIPSKSLIPTNSVVVFSALS